MHVAVWDEEFRFTVYAVEGEVQKLKIVAKRLEHKDEDETIGEAELDITGKWPKNEFDDWVELRHNGKYQGEVFLEMTYYPTLDAVVRFPSPLPSI